MAARIIVPGRLLSEISFVYLSVLGDLRFRTEYYSEDVYLSSVLT